MIDLPSVYKNLLAAIFERAFYDLVYAIRAEERLRKQKETAPTQRMAEDLAPRHRCAAQAVKDLENWCKEVMPAWLDIAPDTFIRWAHEEAKK
jgi:hypothetical protein